MIYYYIQSEKEPIYERILGYSKGKVVVCYMNDGDGSGFTRRCSRTVVRLTDFKDKQCAYWGWKIHKIDNETAMKILFPYIL